MRPFGRALGLAAALLAATSTTPAPAQQAPGAAAARSYEGTELDWALRCKGCHGFDARGTPGHVPRLRGFVGWYTRLPEGRDYLMRVPGVARARLSDERLAALLNWMLRTLSPEEVVDGFAPFTAEEVAQARRLPLVERDATRARLIAELQAGGLIPPGEDGLGTSAEKRAEARTTPFPSIAR